MATSSDRPPRVASLFSGCGGSSLGYKLAGYDVVYANEFVEAARETYAANFPGTRIDGRDVHDVRPEDLPEIDVLDGSPPCQAFSAARQAFEPILGKEVAYSDGKRQESSELFTEYARLLRGVRPKVFVAENVVGLSRGDAKGYYGEILAMLRACGYRVECRIVDASRLGVPQVRRRLIFQGVRDDLGLAPAYPKPGPVTGVSDVLPHIARIQHGGAALRYRSAALPAPTIVASGAHQSQFWYFTGGNFVELRDGTRRRWTIDELKAVFGFPSEFVLTGTFAQQWERLGRSVAPPMMRAIATAIRDGVLSKCAA